MGSSNSWLSKAENVVLKIINIEISNLPILQQITAFVTGFLPAKAAQAITSTENKIASEFKAVADVCVTVGQVATSMMGQDAKTGAQKLKAAVPYVVTLIQQSEVMIGKKIKDEAAFTAAATGITSNFADLLNSLEGQ